MSGVQTCLSLPLHGMTLVLREACEHELLERGECGWGQESPEEHAERVLVARYAQLPEFGQGRKVVPKQRFRRCDISELDGVDFGRKEPHRECEDDIVGDSPKDYGEGGFSLSLEMLAISRPPSTREKGETSAVQMSQSTVTFPPILALPRMETSSICAGSARPITLLPKAF